MPEGKYYLTYHYNSKNQHSFGDIYGYLYIKKNVLLHMDLKFEKTIAEMENK